MWFVKGDSKSWPTFQCHGNDHTMYISKNNNFEKQKNDTFYSEALQQYISWLRGRRITINIHT
jgi:hypothetical protein